MAGWRIISINIDGTIKIIRNNFLTPGRAWDTNGSADWETASLNTYLNNDYYNSLSATAQSQIEPHYFGIWPGKYKIALASRYDVVRADSSITECGDIFKTNSYQCRHGSLALTSWIENFSTFSNMWLLDTDASIVFGNEYGAFGLARGGGISRSSTQEGENSYIGGVRPVLYISSDVKITGGDGSQSNPFVLG